MQHFRLYQHVCTTEQPGEERIVSAEVETPGDLPPLKEAITQKEYESELKAQRQEETGMCCKFPRHILNRCVVQQIASDPFSFLSPEQVQQIALSSINDILQGVDRDFQKQVEALQQKCTIAMDLQK